MIRMGNSSRIRLFTAKLAAVLHTLTATVVLVYDKDGKL